MGNQICNRGIPFDPMLVEARVQSVTDDSEDFGPEASDMKERQMGHKAIVEVTRRYRASLCLASRADEP